MATVIIKHNDGTTSGIEFDSIREAFEYQRTLIKKDRKCVKNISYEVRL